jgi:hypothetical protein
MSFCGRHLLAARLRRANIDASAGSVEEVAHIVGRIRQRWPRVKIVLRADAGFAREAPMAQVAKPTRSIMSSAWPATCAWKSASPPPSMRSAAWHRPAARPPVRELAASRDHRPTILTLAIVTRPGSPIATNWMN